MTLLKSIVVCLVLANVGYFLWSRGIAKAPDAAPATPTATLRLASELPETPHGSNTDGGNVGGAARSGLAGAGGPHAAADADQGAKLALLTNVKRCISVGPFGDVSEAAHAATTLRGGGYDPRQRVADGDVWAGVWVYLPLPPREPRAIKFWPNSRRAESTMRWKCPDRVMVP